MRVCTPGLQHFSNVALHTKRLPTPELDYSILIKNIILTGNKMDFFLHKDDNTAWHTKIGLEAICLYLPYLDYFGFDRSC